MKVTHIFVLCIEHHVIPYIGFIKKELTDDNYQSNIIVYTNNATEKLMSLKDEQVVITPYRADVVETIKSNSLLHKVIIHGFYDSVIFLKLLLSNKKLTFVSWAMWGADVYYTPPKGVRGVIINYARKKVIPKLGHKLGLYCDYAWLFKQLKVSDQGIFNEVCFPAWFYQNSEFSKSLTKNDSNKTKGLSALVGNSADPTNNFIELIDILHSTSAFKKFTFVLNYGGTTEYITKVKEYAQEKLSHCELIFLTDKLDYIDYIQVVSEHDALLYNHARQQGVGSLNIAFELGLAVFIPEENPMTDNYKNWDVKTFTTESLESVSIEKLEEKQYKLENRIIIQGYYHPANVAKKLISIIKGDTKLANNSSTNQCLIIDKSCEKVAKRRR